MTWIVLLFATWALSLYVLVRFLKWAKEARGE